MPGPNETVLANLNAMLAAWREDDPGRLRAHLETALSPEVVFVDPNYAIQGIDAFEDMVQAVRRESPGLIAERTSGIDAHHDICRYTWRVTLADGSFLDGMDVTRLDETGKVLRVDGFFGAFPQFESA